MRNTFMPSAELNMGRTSCTGPLKPKREGRRNVVEGVKKGGYMLSPPPVLGRLGWAEGPWSAAEHFLTIKKICRRRGKLNRTAVSSH